MPSDSIRYALKDLTKFKRRLLSKIQSPKASY
jgi:hypothetical protein